MRSSAFLRAAIPAEAMKRLRRTVSLAGLALVITLFLSAGFAIREEGVGRSFLILNSPLRSPSGSDIFFLIVGLSLDLGLNGRDGRESRDDGGLFLSPKLGLAPNLGGADLSPRGRTEVRPTESDEGGNSIFFLGPDLGALRTSEFLPRKPVLAPRSENLPDGRGRESLGELLRPVPVVGDNVSFFLGDPFGLLLFCDGDDFVNGN